MSNALQPVNAPVTGPGPNGGPSLESWQRDVNELGYDIKFNIEKPQSQNDEVEEFKDLFATGKEKIQKTTGPKVGIDLTYNPGDASLVR